MGGLSRFLTGCDVVWQGGQSHWKGGLVIELGGFPCCVAGSQWPVSSGVSCWADSGWW